MYRNYDQMTNDQFFFELNSEISQMRHFSMTFFLHVKSVL